MDAVTCYRFVGEDLRSINGATQWRVGEWQSIDGPILCCASGLHASRTPRDSIMHIHGRRWFVTEARGELSEQLGKFSAEEMRLIAEIPPLVLRRFAAGTAQAALDHLGSHHPVDARLRDAVDAVNAFLDGRLDLAELQSARAWAMGVVAADARADLGRSDSARLAASVIAATNAAEGDAGPWAAAAAAAAHAAHLTLDTMDAADGLSMAYRSVLNVEQTAAAARAATSLSAMAHEATAAAAAAHAAAVTAARRVPQTDAVSDPYYSAFAAFSAHGVDAYWTEQNALLAAMIESR